MNELIEVEIGGVLAPVDRAEWEANPDAVRAEVLANREAMKLTGPDTTVEAQRIVTEGSLDG